MVEIGGVDAFIASLKVGFQIVSGRESLLYAMPDFNPEPPSGILSTKWRESAKIGLPSTQKDLGTISLPRCRPSATCPLLSPDAQAALHRHNNSCKVEGSIG